MLRVGTSFSTDEAKNLKDIEEAYGFTLSAKEKEFFKTNKFLLKPVPETGIKPDWISENGREMLGLYATVAGH